MDDELEGLKAELPTKWDYYIEQLSSYIASTENKYQNHASTICLWAEDDRLKQQGFTDPAMREWTFADDNGRCQQMEHAHFFVEK